MQDVFLRPARDGRGKSKRVPDPVTAKPLAAEGEWKPLSPYWARRIRDDDVTMVAPPVGGAEETKR